MEGNEVAESHRGSVRHSRRFSDELVEDARRHFQQRTDRQLTNEDARQMLENLTGFFMLLHEWDRADSTSDPGDGSNTNDPPLGFGRERVQTPSESLLREGRDER